MRKHKNFSLFTFHFSLFVVPLHPQLEKKDYKRGKKLEKAILNS